MDALMAALVLGALTQGSDRTPWLAAALADRFRAPAVVIAAALLALALNYAVAVALSGALAPLLTPEARLLLLALALVLAGLGTPWRARAPDRLAGWRTGPWLTALAGIAIHVFGDRMQFVVAALALRSPLPWAAAVGATLGAGAVAAAAALLGERGWTALPLRAFRAAAALVLTVAGLWCALLALRLA